MRLKTIWDLMNTTYDKFIRTTDPMHARKGAEDLQSCMIRGDIYKGVRTRANTASLVSRSGPKWPADGLLPGLRPPRA